MDETSRDQTKVEVKAEKATTKQDIKEFLGLQNATPLAELQQNLGFANKLAPWWLSMDEIEMDGRKVHGPFDPVANILSKFRQYPTLQYDSQVLLGPTDAFRDDTTNNGISLTRLTVPPYAELVDASAEYLQKIGFRPEKPIRGKDWAIPEPTRREFSTIYDNVYVEVVRDEVGKAKNVNLIAYNDK